MGTGKKRDANYVAATATFVKTCVNCGTQKERVSNLEKLTDQRTFLLTPEEFSERFTVMLTDLMLGKSMYFSYIGDEATDDTLTMYMAQQTSDGNHKILGKFKFTDISNKPLLPNQKDEAKAFWKVQGTVTGENESLFAMVALWLTGDPTNKLDEYRSMLLGLKALSSPGEEVDPYFLPKSKHITSKVTRKNSSTYEFTINA